ncbi:MAG: response regulator transcription factor [Ignavibacteriaceae bacterium]
MIKILIANKYFLMNYAISCILKPIEGFEVTGIPEDDLIAGMEKLKPDILILEINILKKDSLKLLSEIKEKFPDVRTLLLLDIEDKEKLLQLLRLNAGGYVLKNISREELIHAAKCIASGKRYISEGINEFLMDDLVNRQNNFHGEDFCESLSEREIDVLKLIISGKNNKQVAGKLFISPNTVLTHRRNLMKKLKVNNTAQLITKSLRYKIISMPD